MATKTAEARALLTVSPDTDDPPICSLDTGELPSALPDLSDFRISTVQMAWSPANQTDLSIEQSNNVAVLLLADQPFSLRYKAGETLLENLRAHLVWAHDLDTAVISEEPLVSTGPNETNFIFVFIDKP